MKLTTLIVDDEPIALEKLKSYVEKVHFLDLAGICRNGIEASEIMSRKHIDLIFTDISMPDMNGLEFIESLLNPPLTVFITAFADYAVESYKLSAVDYLLKPYGFADFQRAANKALEQFKMRMAMNSLDSSETAARNSEDSLFVKVDYRYIPINLNDICYIKGHEEYLQIFTRNSPTPLTTLSSFGSIKEKLPTNFLQVHRSFVVNMNAIHSINKKRIIMDADTYIPIGDSFRDEFLAYLASHSIGTTHRKPS